MPPPSGAFEDDAQVSFAELVAGLDHEDWDDGAYALDPGVFDIVRAEAATAGEAPRGTKKGGTTSRGGSRKGARGTTSRGGSRKGTNGTTSRGGSRRGASGAAGTGGSEARTTCEVDGCAEPRSEHRGAGLCDKHRHADFFVIEGQNYGRPMRWCFYCHRAHDRGAFSAASRSICTEKFMLRQGRRKEQKFQTTTTTTTTINSGGRTRDSAGGGSAPARMADTGRTRSTDSEGNASVVDQQRRSIRDGKAALEALRWRDPNVIPTGYDTKFWVAHPRELQERTDMWDLVRRINAQDEPVGMYGTIVRGCVRFTVRGWESVDNSSASTSANEPLERRLGHKFVDVPENSLEILQKPITVCEMKSTSPRRVDLNNGQVVNARECGSMIGVDVIFASARDELIVATDKNVDVIVRFFSEYVDREVASPVSSSSVSIDPLVDYDRRSALSDHVLSIQAGGYGIAYQHVAVIQDAEIAKELAELDTSVEDAELREHLRAFSFDYVWLSNRVDSMMLYGDKDVERALRIADTARDVFQAWGRSPRAMQRTETLRSELEAMKCLAPVLNDSTSVATCRTTRNHQLAARSASVRRLKTNSH